jgi:putative methyltransferase (TIGR04325 family)
MRFHGAYATWGQAAADAVGYDSDVILEKTRSATLKVRNGEAAFERDSFLMDRPDYPLFLISSLLHVAAVERRLNILDFGGALGSSYFQCRPFVSPVADLRWSVVEQPQYVECGQRELQTDVLRFYATIEACVRAEAPNVVILSGVLQYLERPYELVEQVVASRVPYLVVDRQPLSTSSDESLGVVTVPSQIYAGSYPFWFLNEGRFRAAWAQAYDLIAEAEGPPLSTHRGLLHRRQLFYKRRAS